MARKKHKAKRSASAKAGVPAGGGALPAETGAVRFLPGLGAAALVAAWLAFLGALSGGQLNWTDFLDGDHAHPWRILGDLRAGAAALSDYEHPGSWMWIPDFAILWALYLAGADLAAGALAYPLLQAALSALGWILVCDFLFGKNSVRRAAVLILHAVPFLVVAYGGLDVFYHQGVPRWRYGIWALLPWLWRFSLGALEPAEKGRSKVPALLGLGAATAAAALGELLLLSWFAVPAAAAALGLSALGRAPWRETARFAAVALAAFFVGRALGGEVGVGRHGEHLRFDFAHFAAIAGVARHLLGALAARNPATATVWALFCVFALAGFFLALFGRSGRKTRRGGLPLDAPGSRREVFVALMIPATILIPLLAVLPRVYFGVAQDPGHFFASSHRYFLPTLYLPLFVGWTLLPWKVPGLARGAGGTVAVAAAAAVLVAAAAVPRALAISAEGLDPFSSPFHRCLAENARRLNWTDGVSALLQRSPILENPDAGVERMMQASVGRGENGPDIVLHTYAHNYWRYGEFQFVALNGFNGRVFHALPGPAESGCPAERAHECVFPGHYANILDDASARAVFGEPAEVVECAGFGFFHYDPPLRFDPPGNPREWTVRPRP